MTTSGGPPGYPSLEDTRRAAVKRAERKRDDRSAAEWQVWVTQMGLVRQAAVYSGVEEWTRAHTIGALFACQALRSSVAVLRSLGQLDAVTARMLNQALLEQETISALMEEGNLD